MAERKLADLVDDRTVYANLIARARAEAGEIYRLLEDHEVWVVSGAGFNSHIARLLEEIAVVYLHLSRVRVDSEKIGVDP